MSYDCVIPMAMMLLMNKRLFWKACQARAIIKRIACLTALLLCLLPLNPTRPASASHSLNTAYLYVEIETKVYKKGVEISSENPVPKKTATIPAAISPTEPRYSK